MEEIDSIIIESLRNLHCDIEENITSLKQFDANMVLAAVSTCLETIIAGSTFPKKQSGSMSVKLKIASTLAQQIKELGFRDEIGYQTILYSNETEIRRVLMFLIERLPRDSSKVLHIEQTGYVPTLVKEIERRVKSSLEQFWIPTCVLNKGCRAVEGGYMVSSTGNSAPLIPKKLKIPDSRNTTDEGLKQYWIRNVSEVTKQCSQKKLIPSLLFQDCEIKYDDNFGGVFKMVISEKLGARVELEEPQITVGSTNGSNGETQIVESSENKLGILIQQLKEKQANFNALQEVVKTSQMQLVQSKNTKCDEEEVLKDTIAKIDLKSKTLSVMKKEENLARLKNLVETNNNKLINLANQWNEVQAPLLERYKSLQNTRMTKDAKLQQEQIKVKKLEETFTALSSDLQEKVALEQRLRQKLEHLNKSHNRSGYTKRILEIIANIKKQDNEIQKILKDTREVQKEINNLTGQVDRSFTLSDELIFQDAKNDETARKAYKLLVGLHDECANIIKGVTDLGLAERESRNLQEQIDSETMKETGVKLANVNKDLEEIRRETAVLLQANKN